MFHYPSVTFIRRAPKPPLAKPAKINIHTCKLRSTHQTNHGIVPSARSNLFRGENSSINHSSTTTAGADIFGIPSSIEVRENKQNQNNITWLRVVYHMDTRWEGIRAATWEHVLRERNVPDRRDLTLVWISSPSTYTGYMVSSGLYRKHISNVICGLWALSWSPPPQSYLLMFVMHRGQSYTITKFTGGGSNPLFQRPLCLMFAKIVYQR